MVCCYQLHVAMRTQINTIYVSIYSIYSIYTVTVHSSGKKTVDLLDVQYLLVGHEQRDPASTGSAAFPAYCDRRRDC